MEAIVRARCAAACSRRDARPIRSGARSSAAFGLLDGGRDGGRRAGAGVGAVARARPASAMRWRASTPRHRRADRGGDRSRRARGDRDRRRQRDHRRRPRRAGGARRALHHPDAPTCASCAGRCAACRLSVACDVRNPLLGPEGAARVFAPQKGADAGRRSSELEQRLGRWARLARATTGRDPARRADGGRGAAGWPAGCGRSRAPSCARAPRWCSRWSASTPRMRESFAVVTGEGRLDEQTLAGKARVRGRDPLPAGGVPCYAVVGSDALDAFEQRLLNIEVEAARASGAARPSARARRRAARPRELGQPHPGAVTASS